MRSHDITSCPALDSNTYGGIFAGINKVLQLAIFLSLFSAGLSANQGSGTEGSLMRQITWASFGAIAFLAIARDLYKSGWTDFQSGGAVVWGYAVYAFTSTLWSTTPSATVKRSALLLIVMLVCTACLGKARKTDANFSRILGAPLFVLIGLSVIFTGLFPSLAITELGWRGVTSHKNELGQAMTVALLVVIYGNFPLHLSGFRRATLIIAFTIGLALTRSTTAALAVAIAILTTSILAIPGCVRKLAKWNILLLGLTMGLLIIAFVSFLTGILPSVSELHGLLLSALGKSGTLTGRTALWELVLSQSLYHNPFFGGGYGGFWVGPDSVSGYTAFRSGVYLGQAHNGYLDIYNDLGYVGLALAFLTFLKMIAATSQLFIKGHSEANLHIAIFVLVLVANLAESTLFRTTQFLNVLFLASLVRISALSRDMKISTEGNKSDAN